jgi:sugar phosphate isomerase/epimerase
MRTLSRREFGKVLASVPAAGVIVSSPLFAAEPLRLAVSTSSFRDLPRTTGRDNVDDVLRALQSVHISGIELAFANVEPAPPSTAPFRGGTPAYPRLVILTPEEVAATNAAYRTKLRAWRSDTPISYFEDVKRKCAAAGLTVHACALNYDESFTDEEIETTLRQAAALGVTVIGSAMSLKMAARLAPFAERHQMTIALHNQVDGNTAGAISTAELDKALALSPSFALKLDVGNLTASNCDAAAELRHYLPHVAYVCLKDRLRNGGASQPFGEGDTPIVDVIRVLKTSPSTPVVVDYDYAGLRSSVQEVGAALEYTSRVLN